MPRIYRLQVAAFHSLLEKYQDYDYNPGAEKIERTYQRFDEAVTDYWLINLDSRNIGAVRICNFGKLCKIKQIFILPEYQNNGYLYEKTGYGKTGKTQRIKDGMDIVFYAE